MVAELPLEQAREAHRLIENRETFDKVVLKPLNKAHRESLALRLTQESLVQAVSGCVVAGCNLPTRVAETLRTLEGLNGP